jgi:GntR family transcriptional repressor for pyruvate dehydrogenase complex
MDMPAPLPRLARPVRLSDEVFRALEGRIRAGEFAPGARLPTEKELAGRFGVSRAVVREAVSRLKADGYVETRQGAGAYVGAQPGKLSFRLAPDGAESGEAAQVFELRLLVEAGAAELAARRRTAQDLRGLRRELARMTQALASGLDGAEADDAFHRAIGAATHNAHLGRFMEFLGGQFSETRRPTWADPALAKAAQKEHAKMLAALEAGDARAARTAAQAHLRNTARRLGLLLEKE